MDFGRKRIDELVVLIGVQRLVESDDDDGNDGNGVFSYQSRGIIVEI